MSGALSFHAATPIRFYRLSPPFSASGFKQCRRISASGPIYYESPRASEMPFAYRLSAAAEPSFADGRQIYAY